MARILVVDDERSMREMLEILLRKAGHTVVLEEDVPAACGRLADDEFDLVITDLRLGTRSGIEVLERTKARWPHTEVVMITAYASTENAVQAMRLGAYDYVIKPFKVDEISVVVQKALEKRALVRENASLKKQLDERTRVGNLLGKSAAMRELFSLIERVAPARTTVLVTGESGVGKELVARAIHERSPRAEKPFVAVNCGAIPEGLIESELFGHEKGAFTGATQAKPGLFELADGGTLFLDEIGELPLHVQVKLLRALQQRTVRSVGGVKDVEVDARIVAATNRDLADEVKAGRFREDLYYRLNVIGLKVPPLRARREDVLLLAEHFLRRFGEEQGRTLHLSREAQAALLDYDFPGNVRELENLMERAATLSPDEEIDPDVFPPQLRTHGGAVSVHSAAIDDDGDLPPGFDLQGWLDACERRMLERALAQSGGNKTEAARLLGITFRSIRYRLAKFEMDMAEAEV